MAVFVGGAASRSDGVNYVEYLQSTGAQYIDTKLLDTEGFKLKTTVEFQDVSSYEFIAGTMAISASAYYRSYVMVVDGAWQLGVYTSAQNVSSAVTGTKYEIEISTVSGAGYLKINGVTVQTVSTTYPAHTGLNILLFNINNAGDYIAHMKMWPCQIYDKNDKLIGYFRPCYDPDGVACMFDEVSKEYAYNAGTGEFIAGEAA